MKPGGWFSKVMSLAPFSRNGSRKDEIFSEKIGLLQASETCRLRAAYLSVYVPLT